MNIVTEKACAQCGLTLPAYAFSISGPGYLYSTCKTCKAAADRVRRAAKREAQALGEVTPKFQRGIPARDADPLNEAFCQWRTPADESTELRAPLGVVCDLIVKDVRYRPTRREWERAA